MKATPDSRLRLLVLCLIAAFVPAAIPTSAGAHVQSHREGAVHARKHSGLASASRVRTMATVTTQSPLNGSTVSGAIAWQVTVSGTTPSRVDFAVDGTVKASDSTSPFAYGSGLDTEALSNGTHTLTATAYARKSKLASSTVSVKVENSAPAPEPAPAPAPAPGTCPRP